MSVPAWAATVRVRLAVLYSGLVFGIAAVLLALVYLALAQSVDAKPLDEADQDKFYVTDSGTVKLIDDGGKGAAGQGGGDVVSAADLEVVQEAVNAGTLERLRTYSFAGLGGLFVLSLGIGWWVSGRVLRPLGAVTATAREITASGLGRRIGATGPRDELRELADTIDEMLERLEDAFASQRQLVDDVSHELRNPVAVITANIDAVLSDPDAPRDQRTRAAAAVSSAATSMTQLVEDLLATSRQRSGAFEEREVELGELARGAVEEYAVLVDERGLDLRLRLDDGPVVYADEQAVVRALRNLLSNAVRWSPERGALTVAVGSLEGWAWVAVRDQGPGIPEADRGRVFDRFFSTDGHGHDLAGADRPNGAKGVNGVNGPNGSGHGIGLAISRQIVEAHDGRLVVHSREGGPGSGSTFVAWLPDRTATARARGGAPPAYDPLG